MKTLPIGVRTAQAEHDKVKLWTIDKELDTSSLEGRNLPSSSALKA